MRLLKGKRSQRNVLNDRAVWQAASLLLAYPDDGHADRLDTVDSLLEHISGPAEPLLRRTVAALRDADPLTAATGYVSTFDMRNRTTMYLTYWTGGDTRNRGMQMLAFSDVYKAAGVERPADEAPDYLPVVLEFAATVDPVTGRELMVKHRVPIDVLLQSLIKAESVYAHAIAAVCETLPGVTDKEVREVRELSESGPPAEAVGLEPYSVTVPLGMPKVGAPKMTAPGMAGPRVGAQ